MKKKLVILTATATMMLAAGPASADHLDRPEVRFFGYPGYYDVVDDVNYKNVRERNWRDGRCLVKDIDRDDFIVEYDYDCYY
jgi:hypothetical protein